MIKCRSKELRKWFFDNHNAPVENLLAVCMESCGTYATILWRMPSNDFELMYIHIDNGAEVAPEDIFSTITTKQLKLEK